MRKVLPQRVGMSIRIPLLARRFRIPSVHSSRLPVIDGPTISDQFNYLWQISNTTHVSWAIRQTEGRAEREIVNMTLNSAYLTSTNARNHITIPITKHSYRAAFNKRTVPNALSKLMDNAAWLCNQCFLQSAIVKFGAVIYNELGVVSSNWRKWLE